MEQEENLIDIQNEEVKQVLVHEQGHWWI